MGRNPVRKNLRLFGVCSQTLNLGKTHSRFSALPDLVIVRSRLHPPGLQVSPCSCASTLRSLCFLFRPVQRPGGFSWALKNGPVRPLPACFHRRCVHPHFGCTYTYRITRPFRLGQSPHRNPPSIRGVRIPDTRIRERVSTNSFPLSISRGA